MAKEFHETIKEFNKFYGLPVNEKPILLDIERLKNFKKVLGEEVEEIDQIIAKYEELKSKGNLTEESKIELLTDIADVLGDVVVYVRSEAAKYGIDLEETLDIIMQSNFSKMGKDGKPMYDDRGKVLKGPNYWRPEEKIKELLKKNSN